MEESKPIQSNPLRGEYVKAPNLFERVKEEIEAVMHHERSQSKETHGTSSVINESTPIHEVKDPSIFGRAMEEIEALVQTVNPKKETNHNLQDKEKGFWVFLGRWFEKCCSPKDKKRS